ncbi:MAG: hypothetical protein MJA29_09120, partial [Candidatus Omnitrophica bacterium]|nr:hypothetical protein [Candidatus Omnitrophota bacterium]
FYNPFVDALGEFFFQLFFVSCSVRVLFGITRFFYMLVNPPHSGPSLYVRPKIKVFLRSLKEVVLEPALFCELNSLYFKVLV